MNYDVLIEFYPQDPKNGPVPFSTICNDTLITVILKLLEHNACITSICNRNNFEFYTITDNFHNEYLFTEPPYEPVEMFCNIKVIPRLKDIKCITIDELDDLLICNYETINCKKDNPLYYLSMFSINYSKNLKDNHTSVNNYLCLSKEKFLTLLYLKIEEFFDRI